MPSRTDRSVPAGRIAAAVFVLIACACGGSSPVGPTTAGGSAQNDHPFHRLGTVYEVTGDSSPRFWREPATTSDR